MFARTNSHFLAAYVSEFMLFWASGGEASLNLTTKKGFATVGFNCTLGHPGALHSPSAETAPPPSKPPCQPRHRGPTEIRRNNERAARHQAARGKTAASAKTTSPSPQATAPASASTTSSSSIETPVTVASTPISVPKSPVTATPNTASVTPSHSPIKITSPKSSVSGDKKPVTHYRFKCDECGERLDTKNYLTNHMISEHNHEGDIFNCDVCDFSTSRKVGLTIHKSKKHNEMKQLDGCDSSSEETEIYAEAYWERDYMGTGYQTYLDVIENIESANIT